MSKVNDKELSKSQKILLTCVKNSVSKYYRTLTKDKGLSKCIDSVAIAAAKHVVSEYVYNPFTAIRKKIAQRPTMKESVLKEI